jgi:hypothetical protein
LKFLDLCLKLLDDRPQFGDLLGQFGNRRTGGGRSSVFLGAGGADWSSQNKKIAAAISVMVHFLRCFGATGLAGAVRCMGTSEELFAVDADKA